MTFETTIYNQRTIEIHRIQISSILSSINVYSQEISEGTVGIFKDNDISNLKDRLSKKRLHTPLVSRGIESKVKLESRSPPAS